MEDAHTKSVEEILSFFNADGETGLSDEQVQRAQEKYGPNGKRPQRQQLYERLAPPLLIQCNIQNYVLVYIWRMVSDT